MIMSEHAWVLENVAAHVAGGLEPTERERLQAHVNECSECARAVDTARTADRDLMALFRDVRPGPALEERMVRTLRQTAVRQGSLNAKWVKVVLATAAGALIAVCGAAISMVLDQDEQHGGSARRHWDALGEGRDETPFSRMATTYWRELATQESAGRGNGALVTDGSYGTMSSNNLKQLGFAGKKHSMSTNGELLDSAKLAEEIREQSLLAHLEGKEKRREFDFRGYIGGESSKELPRGDVGKNALGYLPENAPVSSKDGTKEEGGQSGWKDGKQPVGGGSGRHAIFGLTPSGTLTPNADSPAGTPPAMVPSPVDNDSRPRGNFGGGFGGGFGGPGAGIPMTPPAPPGQPKGTTFSPDGRKPALGGDASAAGKIGKDSESPQGTAPSVIGKSVLVEGDKDGEVLKKEFDRLLNEHYFRPDKVFSDDSSKGNQDKAGDNKDAHDRQKMQELAKGDPRGEDKGASGPRPGNPQPKPPVDEPVPAQKIIIRTGELDFEVDSFDAAVATIQKLIAGTKGGYIATINSDKLPNGKVRGSVVVRVPPEQLDALVMGLRKELGKTGELKGQRIGSQDITKQYTDLQSRLKAARTMEERLLNIIKSGKGEIKDLLLAEKELGVWRTKIEELEGELRYYANQVSLSTLTLQMAEKEIRVAATLAESERVQAGVEVEDVEKAMREVLKAVDEAKGHITRSEMKQHAGGQFNALLDFEVAPDAAGPIRDRLKQIGTVTRLDIDRVQTAEGGQKLPKNGKIERGNTRFQVSIYNLANVAPRETVTIRVVAANVADAYRTLRDAITKVKGRVVNTNLNEQDRQNISAQIDFDVRRADEGAVQTALADAGELLTRHVTRAPEGEKVTDQKIAFRVTLYNLANIAPRETVTIRVVATDVAAAYGTLREVIEKAKGRVVNANLNELDKQNVNAQLDFDVRRTEEGLVRKAVAETGDLLSRHVTRAPESESVSDQKVAFKVTLYNLGNVAARETVTITIAADDVAAAYRSLREAITKAKGRVTNANLNEQDRQKVSAQLDFDIRRPEEGVVQTALSAAGDLLSRHVARAPEGENVADQKITFKIEVIPAVAMPPREIARLNVELMDVDDAVAKLVAQVKELNGRVVKGPERVEERSGKVIARVHADVPASVAPAVLEKLKSQVRASQTIPNPQAPEGKLSVVRIEVTFSNPGALVPPDDSLLTQIRHGLSFSLRGLSLSLNVLIVGLLFVLPWLLVIFAIIWVFNRIWRSARPAVQPAMVTATPAPPGATA
jgi:phosphopantetheinyl transferase